MPLTAKQMEYLAIAWQCFDVEPKVHFLKHFWSSAHADSLPQIDYEKFKNVAGLASAASARELMRVTKVCILIIPRLCYVANSMLEQAKERVR